MPDAMVGSDVIEETVHISSCQREPLDDEVTDTDAEFAVERKCSRVSGSDAARSFSFSLFFFFPASRRDASLGRQDDVACGRVM